MLKKLSSAITGIELNRATFKNIPINGLTFVNFFYGNNGVGKTSIARAIEEDDGISWAPGQSANDFDVLVYDQDFINSNFSIYDNLKGVFTFGKEDAEAKKKIAQLQSSKSEKLDKKSQLESQIAEKQKAEEVEEGHFQDSVYEAAKNERNDFKKALEGKLQKRGLANAVLNEKNPQDLNRDDLKRIYDMAFASSEERLELLEIPPISFENLPSMEELMKSSLTSHSDNEFTRFMNELGASDWVWRGHEEFESKSTDRCPYCQQILPENFEELLKKAFNRQYEQDIKHLKSFQNRYGEKAKKYIEALEANLDKKAPEAEKEKVEQYKDKLELLKKDFEINQQRIKEKLQEPSEEIGLEIIDNPIEDICDLIEEINKDIKKQNEVIDNKKKTRFECKARIMEYLAFKVSKNVKDYKTKKATLEKVIESLKAEEVGINKELKDLDAKIFELNKHNANTEAAIDSINNMLDKSGFQGFRIKAKPKVENVYEIVRDNGSIAENLSDGERNFISFLYFAHLVNGSSNPKNLREKIVTIDDPVSAMDSSGLSIVASLVSDMVSACEKGLDKGWNADKAHIKQLFILTHNIPFYNKVTDDQSERENCVSFYLVQKGKENVSSIEPCNGQFMEDIKKGK